MKITTAFLIQLLLLASLVFCGPSPKPDAKPLAKADAKPDAKALAKPQQWWRWRLWRWYQNIRKDRSKCNRWCVWFIGNVLRWPVGKSQNYGGNYGGIYGRSYGGSYGGNYVGNYGGYGRQMYG